MKKKVSIYSILANTMLAIGKTLIGTFFKSATIFADGIHSTVDVLSSAIGYIGIKMSEKPSDKKHPYGHYKFEVIGGLVITTILFVTGIGILYKSYLLLIGPEQKAILGTVAIITMLISTIINGIMAKINIKYGKNENSISLISDGIHFRADAYASIIILVGLLFSKYWIHLDALLAGIIGLYIIWESISVSKEAIDSLMDTSAGEEIENKIREITTNKNKIKLNDLKTQKRGSAITANLIIELPGNLIVEEAAKISEKLRRELMEKINNLKYIVIQINKQDILTNFYKPMFSKGFGWRGKRIFQNKIEKADGKGPKGYCICPKCGYKIEHKRGVPCPTLTCSKCKTKLERK